MANKMTGVELVKFARGKIGTSYVYGMKGRKMSQSDFNELYKKYGDKFVPRSDIKKVGKVCVDCSGLISWATGIALGSSQWMAKANIKKPIGTIVQAPVGALVWMCGHIGIYSGMKNGVPYYIAADGSKYGVREVPLSYNKFTHWLLVESVFSYEMEDDEVVKKEKFEINGKIVEIDAIRKDGRVYPYIRDIAPAMGYEVSNKGAMPKLSKKV